jgi:hypothetical protein
MTPKRRHRPEDPTTGSQRAPEGALARLLSIAGRAAAATQGPWGYLRPSGVICAPDASDVAHCLYDPDAVFIAHARTDIPWLLEQLQAGQGVDLGVSGPLLDRLLLLRAAIRVANERLDALPWQGDGLAAAFADGLEPARARWVGRVLEEVASALDPEALGLKDGHS